MRAPFCAAILPSFFLGSAVVSGALPDHRISTTVWNICAGSVMPQVFSRS
jgi:hypothetical protein